MNILKELTLEAKKAQLAGNYSLALNLYQQAYNKFPNSISAEHNLAAILGDLHRFTESYQHALNALRKGEGASATWLVYARALMGLQLYNEAAYAYQRSVLRNPESYDAHREYAQLLWMMTNDLEKSLELLNTVLQQGEVAALVLLKAQIFEYAGELQRSQQLLHNAAEKWPVVQVFQALSYVSMRIGSTDIALKSIKRALEISPAAFFVRVTASYVYASAGDGEAALLHACEAERIEPRNQEALACKATSLRLLYKTTGDNTYFEKYKSLCDYNRYLAKIPVDVPVGWDTREAFFADLAHELKRLHPFKTHPFGQSVRAGSQLPNLLSLNNPLVNTFRDAIEGPINRYLSTLGNDENPLAKYNSGAWECSGIWSVWLSPGGYHENHIHPQGWLSSACYIELPDVIADENERAGWLKLGQPMFPTQPELDIEHWVKPEVGHLVLFPSYMWHGTSVFKGNKPRLSIALDIVPK
ncbi:putative 2OG-Fe(II) oxygenase [Rheinheimera oceanensis]|uniref:putative 2OG-Fe(II) oxygenase n=1 Tax=Rheinheimera oceanensis TaxID=2817449 RepID=UPI001BFE55C1|nr:putative 2OG-Fe(II) oxygenase [Rheinheimera oceanensis]